MALEGFKPFVIEEFNGRYNKEPDAVDVSPLYASSEANCDYIPGRVFKRPGFTVTGGPAFANKVLTIEEYTQLDGGRNVITLDDASRLSSGSEVSLATLETELVQSSKRANLRMRSDAQFGKQYMAFADKGISGSVKPLMYDALAGVGVDRMTPAPPADAPVLANGGAGTCEIGVHKCRAFYKMRSGAWSALGPAGSITLAAKSKIDITWNVVSNVPVSTVVFAFTPANSEDYYFIPGTNMEQNVRVAISVAGIDFSDAQLIAGTPVSSSTNPDEDLMRQIQLPAQAGFIAYKNRIASWGERSFLVTNGDDGLRNLDFNGGTRSATTGPCGWTEVAAGGDVAACVENSNRTVLAITGDGTNQKGRLQNEGKIFGVWPANVDIMVRVRIRLNPTLPPTQGTFHVFFTGTAAPSADFTVAFADMSTEWRILEGILLADTDNKIGSDWKVNITSGGTGYGGTAISNGKVIEVDWIEPYLAKEPFSHSLVRWSKVNDPEAFDGLTGIMNVAENNGEKLTDAFVLRSNIYFVKEHSLHASYGGLQEPNEWSIEEVSDSVGSYSSHGVGLGDGWAVIAGRDGAYFFDGGVPQRLTDEVRVDWNKINWLYGWQIWVLIDTEHRRLFIGIPYDGSTTINKVLYCRYEGSPLQERRWSLWDLAAWSACFREKSNGERIMIIARDSATSEGQLAKLDEAALNDFGTGAINSFYQTGFVGTPSRRNLFGYITLLCRGSGSMSLQAVDQVGNLQTMPAITLQDPFNMDVERICRIVGERRAFRFGTSVVDTKWDVHKFVVYGKHKPGSMIRGYRE